MPSQRSEQTSEPRRSVSLASIPVDLTEREVADQIEQIRHRLLRVGLREVVRDDRESHVWRIVKPRCGMITWLPQKRSIGQEHRRPGDAPQLTDTGKYGALAQGVDADLRRLREAQGWVSVPIEAFELLVPASCLGQLRGDRRAPHLSDVDPRKLSFVGLDHHQLVAPVEDFGQPPESGNRLLDVQVIVGVDHDSSPTIPFGWRWRSVRLLRPVAVIEIDHVVEVIVLVVAGHRCDPVGQR